MADIIPIKGITYSKEKVKDLATVITPPYDIINEEEQERLYDENPYNVIRLEKTKENQSDNMDKYQKAAKTFSWWLDEKVLTQDKEPAVYYYEQDYVFEDEKITRQGYICGVKLEPYEKGIVLPHEQTLSKPKADRLNLMRSCKANFSPIFGLFPDKEMKTASVYADFKGLTEPQVEFIDTQGYTHRIWVVTEKELINRIKNIMKDKYIFIADGHHRYETALAFNEESKGNANYKDNYNYVMMVLVNLYDPGLLVLPTHRLVKNLPDFNVEDLYNKLKSDFIIEEYDSTTELINALENKNKKNTSIGIYSKERKLAILTFNSQREFKSPKEKLDVSILQKFIFEMHLNIDSKARAEGDFLTYTRSTEEAMGKVENGESQLAFIMNIPDINEVTKVALAQEKMPQKSTYFYPKLVTGLVINSLDS